MRQKYRIRTLGYQGVLDTEEMVTPSRVTLTAYLVQVRRWYGWVTVKEFHDPEDPEYAARYRRSKLERI